MNHPEPLPVFIGLAAACLLVILSACSPPAAVAPSAIPSSTELPPSSVPEASTPRSTATALPTETPDPFAVPDGVVAHLGCSQRLLRVVDLADIGHLESAEDLGIQICRVPVAQVAILAYSSPNPVALSPDNELLANWEDGDDKIRIWSLVTGSEVMELEVESGDSVYILSWSPDGLRLAAETESAPFIRVWDVNSASGTPQFVYDSPNYYSSLTWSPDGSFLAGGLSGGIPPSLWNMTTRMHQKGSIANWPDRPADVFVGTEAIVWSPDGGYIASSYWIHELETDESIELAMILIFDQTGGWQATLLDHMEVAEGLAWSPDGKYLASSSKNVVRLWDTTTWTVLHRLQAQNGWVTSLAWSADGRFLASGSSDGHVILWDISKLP
jgi:WD40 repeat protein